MADPFHIAIVNLSGAHWLGGRYYLENIIRVLSRLEGYGSAFRLSYILPRADPGLADDEIGRLARILEAPEVAAPRPRPFARGRRVVDRKLRGIINPAVHRFLVENKVDFAYPTATGGETKGGYRTAHWVADLQYKHFPHFQRLEVLKGQDRYLSDIIASASTVVVSSEFGAKDCKNFFATPREKLFVMPFRVAFPEGLLDGDIDATLARYHLPERFLLVSNQFWQNKNHMVVFEALGLLKARGVSVNVVFTGHVYDPRLPKYCDEVHSRIHELGIRNEVFLLGAIARTDQVNLMRRAIAIVQPSRFEGWNTTIEEARAIGRPVIASDFPVHTEQAWSDMTQFAMDDPDALAEAMKVQWSTGSPGGTNLVAEAAARERYAGLVQAFGERFLQLCELSRSNRST
jgi:glycosyltransferase involved in cell wall biosynthesis